MILLQFIYVAIGISEWHLGNFQYKGAKHVFANIVLGINMSCNLSYNDMF
jgi:hypothetical protein